MILVKYYRFLKKNPTCPNFGDFKLWYAFSCCGKLCFGIWLFIEICLIIHCPIYLILFGIKDKIIYVLILKKSTIWKKKSNNKIFKNSVSYVQTFLVSTTLVSPIENWLKNSLYFPLSFSFCRFLHPNYLFLWAF